VQTLASALLTAAVAVAYPAAEAISATNTWETLPVERPLPSLTTQSHILHDGARIWFATLGAGKPKPAQFNRSMLEFLDE
jgi:hypothetical protein